MPDKAHWTTGEFFPEPDAPTYNEGADAYQRAILCKEDYRIIPGFAFGETPEQCSANAWLLAASKELLRAVQLLLKKRCPSRRNG